MTDFGPWLRPTMLGPFVTMWGLVTVSHLALGGAGEEVLLAGQHFDSWVMSMLLAGFIASALVVSLIFADVALLWLKWRKLPSGFGGWMSSLLAPFALFYAWNLVGGGGESMLEAALAIALPFPASALVTRFVLGRKP
jgi:hypothetical protein